MDKKILRLTLVIAVSLFWGTAFTGCSDEGKRLRDSI